MGDARAGDNSISITQCVSDLERLASSGGRPEANAVLDLQKLSAKLEICEPQLVKQHQRSIEDALAGLLLKGSPPPVRRMCCACFIQLYTIGNSLPLHARVSSLQALLTSKEALAAKTSELARIAALDCLAALSLSIGDQLAASIPETVSLAAKHCLKGEPSIKVASLDLIAAAVEGLGNSDRNVLTVHAEALKTADRYAKDRTVGNSIRRAAASVYRAVGQVGGAGLWAYVGYSYDDTVKTCIDTLDHPDRSVREAFAVALGEIAAAGDSFAAAEAVKSLRVKKPSKVPVLEGMQRDAVNRCLEQPLAAAEAEGRSSAAVALTQAWLTYLSALQSRKPSLDEAKLVDLAMQLVQLVGTIPPGPGNNVELGSSLSGGEAPHAQACILYVLRTGIVEQLSENGQRLLLDKLAAAVSAATEMAAPAVPSTAVALVLVGDLLDIIGEVDSETRVRVYDPTLLQLSNSCIAIRSQAAVVVGALSVAEPSSAAVMLSDLMQKLTMAIERLASAPARGDIVAPSSGSQTRGGMPESLCRAMNSVNGYALGVAALLGASTRLSLGIPAQLLLSAMDLAKQLVGVPQSRAAAGQAAEREAGYVMLGALMVALPEASAATQRAELLELFRVALDAGAAADLEVKKLTQSGGNGVAAAELFARAAALSALQAYIAGPLASASPQERIPLQRTLAQLLSPTLDAITSQPTLQDPARSRGGSNGAFGGAAAVMQLRLLETYLALPSTSAYAQQHDALTRLCCRPLRASGAETSGTIAATANASLLQLLDGQDAVLGPCPPGHDPQQDALSVFVGAPGGPPLQPWQAGAPMCSRAGEATERLGAAAKFPQPRSLSGILVETQLLLLGPLMAAASQANQIQVLKIMKAAVSEVVDVSVVTTVCCAAMAALSALSATYKAVDDNKVAHSVAELGNLVLGQSDPSPALQRSSAEILAAAAVIGDSAFAQALLRRVVEAMAGTASPVRRSALALAAGAIHRAKGGMAMRSAVGSTIDTMLAVAASASNTTLHLWLAHSMLLIANAAGLSFVPCVKAVLDFAMQLLLNEADYATAGMRPAVARLANAIVAALGPELRLHSPIFNQCRAIIREMEHLEGLASGAQLAQEAVAAEMETVLYTQMLALFAPHVVRGASHVAPLLATLSSRQPALRQAAADTLRHLAERNPEADSWQDVEAALFRALDVETVAAIAAQIRATLRTLLQASAGRQPSRWLASCSAIVLASGPSHDSTTDGDGQASEQRLDKDEDDGDQDGEFGEVVSAAVAPDSGSSALHSSGHLRRSSRPDVSLRMAAMSTPRLRTRLFAAACILELPQDVGSDVRHFDMNAATASTGDWLVAKLQSLVEVGFRMATGTVEALRPIGLALQAEIIERFAAAEDPLQPGARLLELYQAQLVSTLRPALQAGAAPHLAAAGAQLAASFLREGLATSDTVVLGRLMALLTSPLRSLQAGSPPDESRFAEAVAIRARIALLQAHAHCAVFARVCNSAACSSVIAKAHAPIHKQLLQLWAAVVLDAAMTSSPADAMTYTYSPRLFQSASASTVLASVTEQLLAAWPITLDALTSSIAEQASVLDQGEPLASYRKLLPSICQLALERALATATSGSGNANRGGQQHDNVAGEIKWGPHALVPILATCARVGAAAPDTLACKEMLQLMQRILEQVVVPLISADITQQATAAEALAEVAAMIFALVAGPSGPLESAKLQLSKAVATILAVATSLGESINKRATPTAAKTQPTAASATVGSVDVKTRGLVQQQLDVAVSRALSAAASLLSVGAPNPPADKQPESEAREAEAMATESHCVVLAAALQMFRASNVTTGQLASLLSFVTAASSSLAAQQPLLLTAAAGTLLTLAEELIADVDAAPIEAKPASPTALQHLDSAKISQQHMQLQNVLLALLHWNCHLPSSRLHTEEAASAEGANGRESRESSNAIDCNSDPDAIAANDSNVHTARISSSESAGSDSMQNGHLTSASSSAADSLEGIGHPRQSDRGSVEAAHDQINGVSSVQEAPQRQDVSSSHEAVSEGQARRSAAAARRRSLQVLASTQEQGSPGVRIQTLAALRAFLVSPAEALGQADQELASHWAQDAFAAMVPGAASYLRSLLLNLQQLSVADTQVASETLKVLLAAVTAALNSEGAFGSSLGTALATAITKVLLPLLIQTVSPSESAPSAAPVQAQGLQDMALRMVTGLAAGQSATVFRAAVAKLAPSDKQQLQAALKASTKPKPGGTSHQSSKNPTIALRMNFGS